MIAGMPLRGDRGDGGALVDRPFDVVEWLVNMVLGGPLVAFLGWIAAVPAPERAAVRSIGILGL
jgi:hypothetical protein